MESSQYYGQIVAAYVRGRDIQAGAVSEQDAAGVQAIAQLSADDVARLLEIGRAQELPLHYFKRVRMLPRMQWVLGVLRSLQPDSLLDIGSGRGKFLWPLLDAFPDLPVTAVDQNPKRVRDLEAVWKDMLCGSPVSSAMANFAGLSPSTSAPVMTTLALTGDTDKR